MAFCITELVLLHYNKISPQKNNFILTTQATLNTFKLRPMCRKFKARLKFAVSVTKLSFIMQNETLIETLKQEFDSLLLGPRQYWKIWGGGWRDGKRLKFDKAGAKIQKTLICGTTFLSFPKNWGWGKYLPPVPMSDITLIVNDQIWLKNIHINPSKANVPILSITVETSLLIWNGSRYSRMDQAKFVEDGL